jgi:hypothetical protein
MDALDPTRIDAIEEVSYQNSNALETLLQLLIEKGLITEKEFLDKMNALAEEDDGEELEHDADAPRETDNTP